MIMKIVTFAAATLSFAVSKTIASTETHFNTRRVLKPATSYVKPPQTIGHYGHVYYTSPTPPPRKLVDAKVLMGKAKFLIAQGNEVGSGFEKILSGISSEVKAAASLIEEAKKKVEYGHKEYSCDLLELSQSLIEAAVSQATNPEPSFPLVLEKIKRAIGKVEAHIKWLSSQYGYGYATTSVKNALDALVHAADAVESVLAAAAEAQAIGVEGLASLVTVDTAIKEALKYCADDTYQYKDQYALIAYFKKALVAADDAVKVGNSSLIEVIKGFAAFRDQVPLLFEAIDDAFQSIMDAIQSKKGYY